MMELREQIARELSKNSLWAWESFSQSTRDYYLELADRIVGLLAKEGYGRMIDFKKDVHLTCPECGASGFFESIK